MNNLVLKLRIAFRILQRQAMRFTVGFWPLRQFMAYWMVWRKRPEPLPVSDVASFEYFDTDSKKQELSQRGFVGGITATDDQVRSILDFCQCSNAEIGLKDQAKVKRRTVYVPIDAVKPPIDDVSYYYYYDVHNKCKAVRDIVFNKDLLEVVRDYLGSEPTLLFSNIIWTFPTHDKGLRVGEVGQFGFHFDIPDLKSVAVFVYLNDVDEDRGPHVIIEDTHKRKPLKSLFVNKLGGHEAEERYADQIHVLTGKKGTTVIEDIYSYHKATNPRKPRLALKFFYGIQRSTMIHNRNLRDFTKKPYQNKQEESVKELVAA